MVNFEELSAGADYRSFRFRYLIPLAAEVQYFPPELAMFKD